MSEFSVYGCSGVSRKNGSYSRPVPPPKASRVVLDLAGILLLVPGLVATTSYFQSQVSNYDEAGLLTNAFLLERGQLHYRDFYSSYPPGISLLILIAWQALGVSVASARVVGLTLHIVIALAAGRLAGLSSDRSFSCLAAGLAALWLGPLGVAPMAWLAGLAVAGIALCVLVGWWGSRSRSTGVFAGALLGLVSLFRHDLFVYLAFALLAVAVLLSLWQRPRKMFEPSLLWVGAGVLVVVLPPWLYLFAKSGFVRVIRDLYLDQYRYVLPGRILPLDWPSLAPAMPLLTAQLIGLTAPALAAGLILGSRDRARTFSASLMLLALSVAVLPQLLGRSEWGHLLQAVVPGVCLLAVTIERVAGSHSVVARITALVTLGSFVTLAWPLMPSRRAWNPPSLDFSRRESGMPDWQYEAARPAIEFISANTAADDPIFVGNIQHQRVTYNDLSLYYLAGRIGATRHMQFDPGLTTSAEIQQEVIRDLEANQPRVVILLNGGWVWEPNASNQAGSSLLDDYIRAHYREAERSTRHLMLLRRP